MKQDTERVHVACLYNTAKNVVISLNTKHYSEFDYYRATHSKYQNVNCKPSFK